MSYKSYLIIQEFMILTNATASKFLAEKDIPIILRNHTARASAIDSSDLMEQLASLVLNPSEIQMDFMQERLGISFNKASYGPKLLGHYALRLGIYGHWTSPIRRFADLVNHVILHSFLLRGKGFFTVNELTDLCEHINFVKNKIREGQIQYFRLKGIKKHGALQGVINSAPAAETRLVRKLREGLNYSDLEEKIKANTFEARDLFLLFLDSQNNKLLELRKLALDSAVKRKSIFKSLVFIAEQSGKISSLDFHEEEVANRFISKVQCEMDENIIYVETEPYRSKKNSSNQASFLLFCRIFSVSIDGDVDNKDIIEPRGTCNSEIDYISMLHRYQSTKFLDISYSFAEMFDEKGQHRFKCSIAYLNNGIRDEVSGKFEGSKKKAKQSAARKLCKKMNI